MQSMWHHFLFYMIMLIPFCLIYSGLNPITPIFLWRLIFFFVIMNCDLDVVFKFLQHRSAITHSILFSVIAYWTLRDLAKVEFLTDLGGFCFYPVLIHLIGDLKGCYGAGCIAVPFSSKRLNHAQSIAWIIGNGAVIVLYLIYWIK